MLAENCRSGHERIRAGLRDLPDVFHFHAAIDFEVDLAPCFLTIGIDPPARFTVADVMRPPVTTVEQNDQVAGAAYLMKRAGATALVVTQAQAREPVGIITEADFLAVAVRLLGGEIKKSDVEELARPPGQVAV